MSKYYEQLQNHSNENSSRRISRRQEVTELDLFAFAAARKAREQKEPEQEAAPPEEEPVVSSTPEPPPPPPPPVETPHRMVHPPRDPEPESFKKDYSEQDFRTPKIPRLPLSTRRFAEAVFVGLSVLLIILALVKVLRRSSPDIVEPDMEAATAEVESDLIPEPSIVLAEPTPTPSRVAPKPPARVIADSVPLISTPDTIVRMDGDTLVIRFSSGLFSRNDQLSPAAKQTLVLLARELKPLLGSYRLTIVGHTDNETVKRNNLYKDNDELGLLRARAAERFLQSQLGVANGTFRAESAASRDAPYPNDTPDNRKRNRTITLRLVPQPPPP